MGAVEAHDRPACCLQPLSVAVDKAGCRVLQCGCCDRVVPICDDVLLPGTICSRALGHTVPHLSLLGVLWTTEDRLALDRRLQRARTPPPSPAMAALIAEREDLQGILDNTHEDDQGDIKALGWRIEEVEERMRAQEDREREAHKATTPSQGKG